MERRPSSRRAVCLNASGARRMRRCAHTIGQHGYRVGVPSAHYVRGHAVAEIRAVRDRHTRGFEQGRAQIQNCPPSGHALRSA